ncbi:LutC/YkgG family protein [Sulfuricystis multivorans]|uniref:LutC/YkgG family protein n=1 Tax=Sulfuricystis multivorans TaxID=2211108 RepID=UPI000F846943|nr:lactate utilization protein C [Sulfuricystis multivorans]
MSSRDDILGRVRARLNRTPENAVTGRAAIEAALAMKAQGPRPAMPSQKSALVERLVEKSLGFSSTVERIGTYNDAPAAVARYLAGLDLPLRAVVWPQLAHLDWSGAGLTVEARGAVDRDPVGITGCFCAIAETGTLMLCGGPESPASVSLLPETHIALVPASRIVAGMEEGFALARAELGQLPRAINFVSGPSRTGDIEQTIVLGAHGPYRVHLVVVEND